MQIAADGAELLQKAWLDETWTVTIVFEYSPESFTGTEMDFALDVCNAVLRRMAASSRLD